MNRLLATLAFTIAAFTGVFLLTGKKLETEKPRFEALFDSEDKEESAGSLLTPTEIYQPPERSVLLSNTPREFLRDLSQEYRSLLEKVTPSVVNLTIERKAAKLPKLEIKSLLGLAAPETGGLPPSRYEAFACCITDQGHLATNAHLVLGAARMEARGPNGVALPVTLIAVDYPSNLAILKVEGVKTVPVQWSDMLQVKSGDLLFKLQRMAEQPIRLEIGVLLGRSRLPVFADTLPDVDLLKVAFRSPPRQANGILLNAQGELIGWETPVSGEPHSDPQITYALPANAMRQICRALLDEGTLRRAALNVQFQTLTVPLARNLGLTVTEGLLVVSPTVDGGESSLAKNDVLLAFNQERVGSLGQLMRLLSELEPGAEAELSIFRNQQTLTLKTVLVEAPVPLPPWQELHQAGEETGKNAETPGLFDGIEVTRPGPKTSGEIPASGVLVSALNENSPGAWSGLKPGMWILEIDGLPAESPTAFKKLAAEKKELPSSALWINQDGRYFYIILQSNTPDS